MKARRDGSVEELLVWTYRDQKAERNIDGGVGLFEPERDAGDIEWHGVSACGVAAVERIGRLGARVDVFGGDPGIVHEDAWAVHSLVRGLGPRMAAIVMRHAREGARPSVSLSPIEYRPVHARSRDGALKPDVLQLRECDIKRGSMRRNRIDALAVEPVLRVSMVIKARRTYRDWRAALHMLRAALVWREEVRLRSWRVADGLPPRFEDLWPDHPADLREALAAYRRWQISR